MRRKNGFTLTEMLVVIAIIAILAALITPAVYQAMWSARQSKIKIELDQLASGMEAFKAKYGAYPPTNLTCPSNVANSGLQAFVARAFPRYTVTGSLGAQIYNDLVANGVDTTNVNPQAALVFWLVGQNPDVTDPFNRSLAAVTRTPFFSFDTTRLVYSNTIKGTSIGTVATLTSTSPAGNLMYNAPYGNTAYAYFDSTCYGSTMTNTTSIAYTVLSSGVPEYLSTTSQSNNLLGTNTSFMLSNGTGYISPYFADANNNGMIDAGENFAKSSSFQIISAGQDGSFGTTLLAKAPNFRLYPIGVGYDASGADNDNITNFCEKNNLDAAKP